MTQEGRDISGWQGAYGFPAVDFTIAKATEGTGFRDPQWTRNQSILLQPGRMVAGSYHFFRGDPNEVDWYLSQHDPRCFSPDMPWIFVLDAEAEGDAGAVNQFLARLKARLGYDPWFYSYGAWINARPGIDRSYPLWIAAPSSPQGSPPGYGWSAVTAHQWGTVNNVDANLFLGDRTALLKLAGIGAAPAPALTEEDMEEVIQGNATAGDPDGPGAIYFRAGAFKIHLGTPPEVVRALARVKQDKVHVWEQADVDRLLDLKSMSGLYETFDPNGLNTKLDQVLALAPKLDQILERLPAKP